MKLKTYFNAALLCLAAGLLAACADDIMGDGNKDKQVKEEVKGVHFTINEPRLSSKTRSAVLGDRDGNSATGKTRTGIKHTPGQGAEAYWSEGDRIWVQDKNGNWQQSISTVLRDGGASAEFTLPGTQADYSEGCDVRYVGIDVFLTPMNGGNPEIDPNQPQLIPNDFSKAGEYGGCGTGTAHATGNPQKWNFTLEHAVSYLCLLPRCENAALGQNIVLTNVMVEAADIATDKPDWIAADGASCTMSSGLLSLNYYANTPSAYLYASNSVGGTVNNFPLTNTTTNAATNACYLLLLPGTHDLTVTYTIKDKVTNVETTVKKPLGSVVCNAGQINDITTWIDKDLKGNHTDYYLWGAQEPLTKDALQLAPGDPQAANQANTIPNALFSTLPNANELCWYAYKGDVHWGQSLDVYVVNGHLKHIKGIWLKKKAKILADEHISASYMENGYPRFDNNVYKDWRNVYFETGLPAAAYPQLLAPKTTPVPNTQDYFFLPLLGYKPFGNYISSVDDTAFYWSSSSPIRQQAWVLDIYNLGIKVITATKYQSGFIVMPFQ